MNGSAACEPCLHTKNYGEPPLTCVALLKCGIRVTKNGAIAVRNNGLGRANAIIPFLFLSIGLDGRLRYANPPFRLLRDRSGYGVEIGVGRRAAYSTGLLKSGNLRFIGHTWNERNEN